MQRITYRKALGTFLNHPDSLHVKTRKVQKAEWTEVRWKFKFNRIQIRAHLPITFLYFIIIKLIYDMIIIDNTYMQGICMYFLLIHLIFITKIGHDIGRLPGIYNKIFINVSFDYPTFFIVNCFINLNYYSSL